MQHIMTPRRGSVSAMFGFPFETSRKRIVPSASLFEAGPVHSHFRACWMKVYPIGSVYAERVYHLCYWKLYATARDQPF